MPMTVVMMAVSELEPQIKILILAVVLAAAMISSTTTLSTIASAPVAALLGIDSSRSIRCSACLRGLKQDGATSLLSKRCGKPSNHRLPAEVRTLALSIAVHRSVHRPR
jgi:hypothetical protein